MPEPKYVESLRDEIATLDHKIDDFNDRFDRKIDDFHEKFDQKVDALGENLHEVEKALTQVSTSLKTFIQRVDKTGDRQWQLFLAVIGLMVSLVAASAASFWQVQQHGKQLEQLEKSVEKFGAIETSIVRLDATVARLEKSLGKHD